MVNSPPENAPQSAPNAIFVTWMQFHGRSEGIARKLGIAAWFSGGGGGPEPIRDVRRWSQTLRVLRTQQPDAVIVMQPAVITLWCVLIYANRRRRHGAAVKVAGDLHSGVFNEPGNRLAKNHTLRLLKRHGLAIVTNETHARLARAKQCPVQVLHNLIEVAHLDATPFENSVLASVADRPFVLVPLAYAHDEPLADLLAAAGATPDLCWVFTGRAPRKIVATAPANVSFPGHVSNDDFFRACSQAAVVVAMTTEEDTMQNAAYEALSYGRPLVTSDTAVLSEYYAGAAAIVAPRAAEIADGVRRTLADPTASERMIELRTRRIAEQEQSLLTLRDWLDVH